jgi:signal transduction histidine kinase
MNNIKFIVTALPKLLKKLFDYITDRLRFSISFKITTFYAFVFSFFLILSNLATVGVFIGSIHQNAENIYQEQALIYIQFASSTIEVSRYLGILLFVIFATDIIFITLILGIGSKMSKKLLFPVKKMTETVNQVSLQDLNTRLDVKGSKDELKDLAKTFNDMMDRIQKSYEQQNRFVSDASHELRTPISVIQGYANLLDRWGKEDKSVLEESITAIKSEAENMKDLVEKLLFLARSDKNTQKVELTDFKLNELVEELIKETKLIDTKHKIINEYNEKVIINGDKKLLKEAFRIFIDNSIKYTPENGIIKINLYTKAKQLILEIEDTGIGISKEHLPHIFDRFYRADESRTKETGGTGLGLSIAKWIILKHKGNIEVQSKPGYGTRFIIILPRKL